MSSPQPSAGQRQAFADYVASCQFFDERGYLDLEKFCMHLYLSLFCDSVSAPEPIALYELMLKQVGKIKNRKKLEKIYKQYVPNWKESLRSYYPDEQRTSIHFDLLAEVYSAWILQVGTGLLKYPNPLKEKGRFWIRAEWPLTSQYVNRFEVELVRLAGLSRFLGASAFH